MHIRVGHHGNPYLLYVDRHCCVYILIPWKRGFITPQIHQQGKKITREGWDVSGKERAGSHSYDGLKIEQISAKDIFYRAASFQAHSLHSHESVHIHE